MKLLSVSMYLAVGCICLINGKQMVGNFRPIASNDSTLMSALEHVHPQIEDHFPESHYAHRVTKILQAYSQVVAGIRYCVFFRLLEQHDCPKSSAGQCPPPTQPFPSSSSSLDRRYVCLADIWVKVWQNFYRLQQMQCTLSEWRVNSPAAFPISFLYFCTATYGSTHVVNQ